MPLRLRTHTAWLVYVLRASTCSSRKGNQEHTSNIPFFKSSLLYHFIVCIGCDINFLGTDESATSEVDFSEDSTCTSRVPPSTQVSSYTSSVPVSNGVLCLSDNAPSSHAWIVCNEGHAVIGTESDSEERVCKGDGRWSGQVACLALEEKSEYVIC